MYNSKPVLLAIAIFVIFFTAPFWVSGGDYKRPEIVLPIENINLPHEGKQCVESAKFMRAEHMRLLNDWRDQALRKENRIYVASDGKKWQISLQNTCLKCHANWQDFCDKCHVANNVSPYCWTCHVLPSRSEK